MIRPWQPDLRSDPGASAGVPFLKDGDLMVWNRSPSQYVADRFQRRGCCRGREGAGGGALVATEMHGGFANAPESSWTFAPATDARCVYQSRPNRAHCALAFERFGTGGAMLFGRFSIADCMYAPVVTRFVTYGVPLDPVCAAYRDAVLALAPMQEWIAAAKAEPWSMAA
jgi:glutathione S-transferase